MSIRSHQPPCDKRGEVTSILRKGHAVHFKGRKEGREEMGLTASYGALGNEENSDPELAWRIRHGLEKPAKRNDVTMKLCIVGGAVGVSLTSAAERVIFKMAMDILAPFRLFVAQVFVLFYTLALSIPLAVRLVRHWDDGTFIGESQIILIFCCCHGSYTRRACLSRRVK